MKRLLLGIVIGLAAGGVGVWTVLQRRGGEEHEKDEKTEHEASHLQHGTNGETYLKLDAAEQRQAGLSFAALEKMQRAPEVRGYGRVLDPASLATGLGEIGAAQAQLEASAKEFQRLKVLHEQDQNASTRVLEAAQAAVKRDQIQHEAAQVRFAAAWGRALAELPNLNGVASALVAQQVALVRVDVPPGDPIPGSPTGARVALMTGPDSLWPADLLGVAPAVDIQTQGSGFLFLVKTNVLRPNAAVLAWLSLPGELEAGVLIPRSAIVRHEGEAFVYVQTGDETFARHELELEHPLEQGWFTASPELPPGTKIVITGAQQLLSEELKTSNEQ